jgi:hypothetical protein
MRRCELHGKSQPLPGKSRIVSSAPRLVCHRAFISPDLNVLLRRTPGREKNMPMPGALPLLLLATGSAPATAQPITAEQALKRYREQFRSVPEMDCPRDNTEIVVCGRGGRDRPPPYPREEGATVRLLPGEPPGAAAALGAGNMCFRNCEPPVGNIRNIIKGIGHLLGRDE